MPDMSKGISDADAKMIVDTIRRDLEEAIQNMAHCNSNGNGEGWSAAWGRTHAYRRTLHAIWEFGRYGEPFSTLEERIAPLMKITGKEGNKENE